MRFKVMLATIAGALLAQVAAAQTPAPAAPPAPDPQNILYLDLSTGGRVAIQLRPDKAPNSVERIKVLTRRGFYDGLTFHRVIEGFMAQTGDPKGTGEGGSDLPDLKAEFNDMPHVRGEMAMARAQSEDSANSQFFIMLSPNLRLDGKYSPIGRVVSGMAYVDAIERGEPPANPSRILRASLASDGIAPPPVAAAPAGPPQDAPAATAPAASAQAAPVANGAARADAAKIAPEPAAQRVGAAAKTARRKR
ncbi:MAG: peptidyl-prolyl cis-trans isomerase, cyclophilin type [Sphingomonas bacterium]|nr:peptidylprolyl isomerase [Sphingomonas bacterium]MDB5689595.1 peptidyl-prolyl cis-trans isomerase, cyclophilin type [Sphingomonas bacterium]